MILLKQLFACTSTTVLALAAEDLSSSLVWKSGGISLSGPSQVDLFPEGLYPYHSKSLEWSEEAYRNEKLEVERGISYGKEDRQKLDVWMPNKNMQKKVRGSHNKNISDTKLPIVIMVHGGGWEVGYREYNGFIAQNLCFHSETREPQAIMITPSYKLGYSREQMWPQSQDDILQVITWLKEERENIVKKFGGDPSKIILSGHSAGAHLSACVGLCNKDIDPNIKGIFPISGPIGLRSKDWITESSGVRSWFRNKRLRLFGLDKNRQKQMNTMLRPIIGKDGTIDQNNLLLQQASPLAHIEKLNRKERSRLPFVHFSYASIGDFPMLSMQAKKLKRLLHERAEILVLPVDNHLESHFCLKERNCQWYKVLSSFLDSINNENE